MKRVISLLLTPVLLVCLFTACAAPAAENSAPTWQEQYDLGMRYLTEGNYEEAIVAFTAAIEIDPKRAELYVGRGDAYVGLAQSAESKDAAAEYYQAALKDYEEAQALGGGSASAKLEDAQRAMSELETSAGPERNDALLEPLFALFASGDLDGAAALMRQSEYIALSESLAGSCAAYERDGYCVAVYADQYYYYGGWSNGTRTGHGVWMRAVYGDDTRTARYLYDGEWANDAPNGSGMITETNDLSKVELDADHTYPTDITVAGGFKDGMYDGAITLTWHMNSGETHIWNLTAASGVYVEQPIPERFQAHREYMREDEYFVGVSQDDADLWWSARVNAVDGF